MAVLRWRQGERGACFLASRHTADWLRYLGLLALALGPSGTGCGGDVDAEQGSATAGGGNGGSCADCPCPSEAPVTGDVCETDSDEVCLYADIMGCSLLYACLHGDGAIQQWETIGGATGGESCSCGRCEPGDEPVDACAPGDECYEASCDGVVVTWCRSAR